MTKSHYQLFVCCVPVRGYVRSAVYDLQRRDYWFVPNNLCDILLKEKGVSIAEIKKKHKEIDIDGYFDFLFENEICFPCYKEDLDLFPTLNKQWHTPFEFENCIIDFSRELLKELPNIASQVSGFAIPNVQLRFYHDISEKELENVIRAFYQSKIKFIELIVPDGFTDEFIDNLIAHTPKIRLIVLTSSGKRGRRDVKQATVFKTGEQVMSHYQCGLIQEEQFVTDMRTFCESLQFNTCLNCKLSIDTHGNIKNCPSMKQSFGNIRDTKIEEALQHKGFKKYWNLSKDETEVCKHCEYRHMCTDCRAYVKQPGNIYSQPAKCTYNPYLAKWKHQEGYLPVEACGVYNTKGEFVVNKQKVDRINLKLWGE